MSQILEKGRKYFEIMESRLSDKEEEFKVHSN